MSAVLALQILSACAGMGSQAEPPLSHVCQFRECVCADANAMFWQIAETTPIQWRENGDASCSPGYELKRAEGAKP